MLSRENIACPPVEMCRSRLDELLRKFTQLHLLVVGDFFLDKYLAIDRRISEVSLETGLEARQVVEVRCSPGGAGAVMANLRSLGVNVTAVGVIGDDGEGYELRRCLTQLNVNIDSLVQRIGLFTPTYTKPVALEPDGRKRELERLDIKNRVPLPADVEDQIIQRLRMLAPEADGVIVVDQVQEPNCGVITDGVREEIIALARKYADKPFAADSRERIGLFPGLIVKPNRREAALAAGLDRGDQVDSLAMASKFAAEIFRGGQKPVFLTAGQHGILLRTESDCRLVPAVAVDGEIDTVGAGDSVMAGIVSALCSGAEPAEAAMIGNIIASITIQQLCTTGVATPAQVKERFEQLGSKRPMRVRHGG